MLALAAPHTQPEPATADWEVIDLLLSDERFVQELFEDIVNHEWPTAPHAPTRNPPGAGGSTAGAEKPEPSSLGARLIPQYQIHRPGTGGWARERSPPHVS